VRDLVVGLKILRLRLSEWLRYDSRLARLLISLAMRVAEKTLAARGDLERALAILGLHWRGLDAPFASGYCESRLELYRSRLGPQRVLDAWSSLAGRGFDPALASQLADTVREGEGDGVYHRRLIVLAAPRVDQRGAILLKYTEYFRYFLRVFDSQIFDRFDVVLEPSYVGYCLPDILEFQRAKRPVFVQVWEDRDRSLLERFAPRLRPVPLSPNAWTDHRIFRPLDGVKREYDVVTVGHWNPIKRHHALFRALRASGNRRIRVACVGAAWGGTRESVEAQAEWYQVRPQVDFYDSLDQTELNVLLNRSRAAILLSRKEGANKAIVESMFAGLPSFMRSGFNYGTEYPYMNQATGGFFEESGLSRLLCRIHEGEFSGLRPRDWVMQNWSPERSTVTLEECLFGDVSGRLAVKVNAPDVRYRDEASRPDLRDAYLELREFLAV
jgi:glycosyltransferase involved in cell wall biosynthesis